MIIKEKHLGFAAALLTLLSLTASAQSYDQHAVSIVFTDQHRLHAVDTVIPASEAALEELLQHHDLVRSEVHLVRMDELTHWIPEGAEQKEVIVIQAEEIEDGESTSHKLELIRVNGEVKDLDMLSEEERQHIEEQVANARKGHKHQVHEVIEQMIVIDDEGSNEAQGIRIEKVVENGHEEIRAWVNGKEISEEEALGLLRLEKEKHTSDGPSEVVFMKKIDASDHAEEAQVDINVSVEPAKGPHRAVVILKKMQVSSTGEELSAPEGSIGVFPNPAQKQATITFDGSIEGTYTMSISNLTGQTLWTEQNNAQGPVRQTIDLETYSAGTYIITLSHDRGVHSQKMVIE